MLSLAPRDRRLLRAEPPETQRRVMPDGCRDCANRLVGHCPTWPLGSW